MKLNETQISKVRADTGLTPVGPETPALPELERLFGEHSYFIGEPGLIVFEPDEDAGSSLKRPARGWRLARWVEHEGDKALDSLDERERTEIVVDVFESSQTSVH